MGLVVIFQYYERYIYIYFTRIIILTNYYILIGNCTKNIRSIRKRGISSIVTDESEINIYIVIVICLQNI